MFRPEPQTTEPQKPCSAVSVALETESHQPLTDIVVQLTGTDSNAFAIMGRVTEALRRGGRRDLVDEFRERATAGDFDHLLQTCMEFVQVQ